jgi:hypothetical protein
MTEPSLLIPWAQTQSPSSFQCEYKGLLHCKGWGLASQIHQSWDISRQFGNFRSLQGRTCTWFITMNHWNLYEATGTGMFASGVWLLLSHPSGVWGCTRLGAKLFWLLSGVFFKCGWQIPELNRDFNGKHIYKWMIMDHVCIKNP